MPEGPEQRGDVQWPDYPCPECGEEIWYDGFDDATTVEGQDDYRSVAHCAICELVVVSRHHGPHLWDGDDDE